MVPTDPRVLFVSSHAAEGGSERHLVRLLDALDAQTVAGVVALQDGPLVDRLRADGRWFVAVMDTGAGPLDVLRAARQLRRTVRDIGPDVVHANGVKAALVATVARLSQPVVWNKHDHAYDGRVGRWVAARTAAVVGVSDSALAAVRDRARRAVVAPPLVGAIVGDAARGRAQLTDMTQDAGPVVVVVGRLERAKGQLDAIDALPAVRASIPAHLVLVGGPQHTEPDHDQLLLRRAADLGINEHVTLTGHRDDVLDLVAGADVLVVTSHAVDRRGMGAEGFGLAALEAMALGTPVVGYDAGAVREVVGDCGALVPPGDRDALASAVTSVLRDAARSRAMSECGRSRAARFVDGTATVATLQAAYREAAGR